MTEGLSFRKRQLVNTYASYRFKPTLNLGATCTWGSGVPMSGFLRREAENLYKWFSYDPWKFTLYGNW